MKKVLLVCTVFTLLALGVWYTYSKTTPRLAATETALRAEQSPGRGGSASQMSSPRVATVTSVMTEVTVKIPTLRIHADVESVGLDKQGNMDIPKNAQNVGWYNLGVKPGQQGNAVIAGHYDTATGAPAVFYKLVDLDVGDEIHVEDEKGTVFKYAVTDEKTYKSEEFPLQAVFGVTDKYRLNLITCSGQFNNAANNYSHRTVIYSELVH